MKKKRTALCLLAALCMLLGAGSSMAAGTSQGRSSADTNAIQADGAADIHALYLENGSGAGAVQAAAAKNAQSVPTADGAPIRAVTYAGHEWVINFWSTETEYLQEDFAKILEDGFNTIILCVPWREFQPHIATSFFNEAALQKLSAICGEAGRQGLSVMLRLGYTWDYYDNSDVLERFQKLIYDENHQDAWLRYAKKIYDTASQHSSFIGAFLTWEDFWNFAETEKTLAGTYTGRMLAEKMGFTDYVLAHADYEERLLLYGDEALAKEPAFPSPESPAYRYFFDWYDDWLLQLLHKTQAVFPNLSMECRLDQDPYPLPENGGLAGYHHGKTFACADAGYSSLMLSASMGFGDGRQISADEACGMSAHLLRSAQVYANKPLFVDQFLYMETTPGYEDLSAFPAEEVNSYLERMGDVFRKQTAGYGIWTYRDYADNLIYNPEFGLALSGWRASGSVSVEAYGGSQMAAMQKGSMLSQDLSYRNFLGQGPTLLSLRAVSEEPVRLTVSVGGSTRELTVNGDEQLSLQFSERLGQEIKIYAAGAVLIDDVKLYTHVTRGGIYELDGSEGPYLAGIRACNAKLK